MKKYLIKTLAIIFLLNTNLSATDWSTREGETISGYFKSNYKMSFPLEKGEWIAVDKYAEKIGWGIAIEGITFVQMENNVPVKAFEISRATGLGKWQAYLTSAIYGAVFNPKEDGCKKRQHYNYLKFYKKGNAHNCMVVNILDVQRALSPSDYDSDAIFSLGIRNWVKKEKVDLPKNYLWYWSSYVSMAVRSEWYVMSYGITPEKFANYKPKFTQRDSSEFHPDNIDNYPEAKKIMKRWIKKSAQMHKDFEEFQKMKKSQKLDLSEHIEIKLKKKKINSANTSNNITNELKKLNEMFKSGILTEEEFIKAKKKVLN